MKLGGRTWVVSKPAIKRPPCSPYPKIVKSNIVGTQCLKTTSIECLGLSLKANPFQGEQTHVFWGPALLWESRDGSKASWKSIFLGRWKLKCWIQNLKFLFVCPFFFRSEIRWFRFLESHPFQNSHGGFHFGGCRSRSSWRVEWFRFQVCRYPTEDYFAIQCHGKNPMLWGEVAEVMCGEWMR